MAHVTVPDAIIHASVREISVKSALVGGVGSTRSAITDVLDAPREPSTSNETASGV